MIYALENFYLGYLWYFVFASIRLFTMCCNPLFPNLEHRSIQNLGSYYLYYMLSNFQRSFFGSVFFFFFNILGTAMAASGMTTVMLFLDASASQVIALSVSLIKTWTYLIHQYLIREQYNWHNWELNLQSFCTRSFLSNCWAAGFDLHSLDLSRPCQCNVDGQLGYFFFNLNALLGFKY